MELNANNTAAGARYRWILAAKKVENKPGDGVAGIPVIVL